MPSYSQSSGGGPSKAHTRGEGAPAGRRAWPGPGIDANRENIATLIQYSHEQGLIDRVLEVDELFPDSAGENYKI